MKLTNLGVQLLPVVFALNCIGFYALGSIAGSITCGALAMVSFTMLLNENGNSNPN